MSGCVFVDEHLNELQSIFVEHGVVLAYLFGSHAEGTARSSSDVDFAVLLPPGTPREKFFRVRLDLTNALMDVFHRDVDVVILNEAPPLLAHQVVKFGRVVFEDPRTLPAVDFIVYAVSRYSDTRSTRALARRYLEEAIEDFRRSRAGRPREPFRWRHS